MTQDNGVVRRLFLEDIDRRGDDRQLIKCCEKMAALSQAICQRFDEGVDDSESLEAIVENLTEVEIMLEQLRLILNVDAAMEERWLDRKLRRMMAGLGI